jgi:hypothetical protein
LFGPHTNGRTLFEVYENRVLRRIFGPKREEVAGGWRRLHNEEFHTLYFSPNIVTVINSRRMRWEGHVAQMGEVRNLYLFFENPNGKDNLEDLGVNERKILEWTFEQQGGNFWTEFIWLRMRTSEHGKKPSGSIEGGEFFH